MIQRLQLRNFRSFKDVDIELRPLNIVVGANASGKTNLVQAFRFLRDLAQHGLENAVSLQGGVDYLTNLNSQEREFYVSVTYRFSKVEKAPSLAILMPTSATHRFVYEGRFRVIRSRQTAAVVSERMVFDLAVFEEHRRSEGQVRLERRGTNARLQVDAALEGVKLAFLPPKGKRHFRVPTSISLLQFPVPFLPLFFFFQDAIRVYDFVPHLAKQPIPIQREFRLSETGDNLPIVLEHLLNHSDQRATLLKLVQLVLPDIKDLRVAPVGRHITLQAREKYFDKRVVPAALLSDGTVEVVALIVAMFFTDEPNNKEKLLIFEEPDRHLHPAILGSMLSLFEAAAEINQILITTHNPELVRRADLDCLLLIERDREGNSIIKRPADSERVKIFIEEQLGLDYLHANQMLGV